jgi:hypothetical protein
MHKKQTVLKIFLVFLSLMLALPSYILGEVAGSIPPQNKFSKEELDQMLAPIALYPDSLLAQMLMAATYPLEVVAADRWVKGTPNLKGDALDAALKDKDWDVSVESLTHFPEVLAMMDEKIEWTTRVGDAFLAQKDDVMDSIQKLRAKAEATGNLRSTKEQKVVNEQGAIEIEPADGGTIYVPEYDPLIVYYPWWYPAFPPFAFYYPGVVYDGFFCFAFGFAWGFGWGWCDCDWHHHCINIDYDRCGHFHRFDHDRFHGKGNWQHDPVHRQGVAYRDQATGNRFGVANQVRTTNHRFSVQGSHPSATGSGGGYYHGGYSKGSYSQGGYNHGGYSKGSYSQGGYNHGGYSKGGYPQGGYNHGGYSKGGYNPGGGGHGGGTAGNSGSSGGHGGGR